MMRAARMQSLRLIDLPRLAAHRRALANGSSTDGSAAEPAPASEASVAASEPAGDELPA
jgi:hypothetical protein